MKGNYFDIEKKFGKTYILTYSPKIILIEKCFSIKIKRNKTKRYAKDWFERNKCNDILNIFMIQIFSRIVRS